MKHIEYFTKSVYGRELSYLADVKLASTVSCLTQSKTMSPHDFSNLANVIELSTGEQVKFVQVLEPKTK